MSDHFEHQQILAEYKRVLACYLEAHTAMLRMAEDAEAEAADFVRMNKVVQALSVRMVELRPTVFNIIERGMYREHI